MTNFDFKYMLEKMYAAFGKENPPRENSNVYKYLFEDVNFIPPSFCNGIIAKIKEKDSLPTNLGKAILSAYYSLLPTREPVNNIGCEKCQSGYLFFVDYNHKSGVCTKCPDCNKGDQMHIDDLLNNGYFAVPKGTTPHLIWQIHFDPDFDYNAYLENQDEFFNNLFKGARENPQPVNVLLDNVASNVKITHDYDELPFFM